MMALVKSIPSTGRLEVDIKVTADINISAYAARQKVNGFVLSEISYMMHAGEPTLVIGDRICWRVPIILSQTSKGDIGETGSIDVDVETGQLHISPKQITEIETRAEDLIRLQMYPINDEWSEEEWLKAVAKNPVFDYLKDSAEDIYTLNDGKPFEPTAVPEPTPKDG